MLSIILNSLILLVGLSNINGNMFSTRVDAFEDGMLDVMKSVAGGIASSPLNLKKIGRQYWKYFQAGPLGKIGNIGTKYLSQKRRRWNRNEEIKEESDYHYETYDEYETQKNEMEEYQENDERPDYYEHTDFQMKMSPWDDWKF